MKPGDLVEYKTFYGTDVFYALVIEFYGVDDDIVVRWIDDGSVERVFFNPARWTVISTA